MENNREYFGFTGKLLKIDLTNEVVSFDKLNKSYTKDFLGGAGYASRYLYDFLDKNTDPLSKNNILMIMTGPFCGTAAPSSGRFVICSKSPYTNLWGESNCGGDFGTELKKAGFDGVIITGKAEKLSFVTIIDDKINILNATSYQAKGIKETQDKIKKNYVDPRIKILSIGQAGENLVKFASVNANGRTAGRTGMGAVMGSKNLKAIVVKGTGYKLNIAKPVEFKDDVKKTINYILKTKATETLRNFGTSAGVITAHSFGDLPIKYWSQGEWKDAFNISGEKLREHHLLKTRSCYGCSISCGRVIEIKAKKHLYPECEGPEYETIAGFGSMILNNNLESIALANFLCNDYGLDTISTSGVIALLYNLYNRGIVKKEDIDDLELKWGQIDNLNALIEKIAYRKGIGDLLAKGSNYVGQKFGVSKEEIATINNLEVPYHDIRACFGMALTYAFGPTGPSHTSADIFKVGREGNEIDFSSVGVSKINMYSNGKDMAIATANLQDYRALYSSLISCFFSNPLPELTTQLINDLFGTQSDVGAIKTTGERIFNMKRLFNIKMGLTSENDYIPEILLNPIKEGAAKGKVPDFKKLKKYYYQIRDWNSKTGVPNLNKLKELNLLR